MSGSRGLLAVVLVAALLGLTTNALAYPRPGRTERVSLASSGAEGDGGEDASLSADHRYVAFHSRATDLVPNDTNTALDVFVYDRATGVTERVSVDGSGAQGNGDSGSPTISADGRYIAFESSASNLVPGDTKGRKDAFVHDRVTGTTERISVSSTGDEANAASFSPSLSADARYVAFSGFASNLVPGDIPGVPGGARRPEQVFVRDRQTGTTERISMRSDGAEGDEDSQFAAISGDGRYVVFHSYASDLVPDDTNDAVDVFVYDRTTRTTERVSVNSDGVQANEVSLFPSISADGRHIAFQSGASNLVPRDTNGRPDVFVHDRDTGMTERVSVRSDGAEAHDADFVPAFSESSSISADGRYVAFHSWASNLVLGDTNQTYDAFVHDRESGTTERVSLRSDGAESNGHSQMASIAGNGRFVAFHSWASNLVPDDTNQRSDVLVRDRGPAVGVGELVPVIEGERISTSGWATFAGDVVSSVTDPHDDGAVGAEPAGGELLGASVISRPEDEDLLFRWLVSRFSEPGGGSPGVVYGFRFEHSGERYEVRALLGETAEFLVPTPNFALYRCAPECRHQEFLSGGIGTVGKDVRVSLPLDVLDAEPGDAVAAVRAYTSLGEAGPGPVVALDNADLPDAVIPSTRVHLGIAPTGTPESDVAFDAVAELADGWFTGSLDASSLLDGNYGVWAKACRDDVCGVASTPVTVGDGSDPNPTPMPTSAPPGEAVHKDQGRIHGSNPATPGGFGITENEFALSCDIPSSQGIDGRVFQIPAKFGSGGATATLSGSQSAVGHDLDMVFYDAGCDFLGRVGSAADDETAPVPVGTRWIVANAFFGMDTLASLTVTQSGDIEPTPTPTGTASPIPSESTTASPSPSDSASPSPSESPQLESTTVTFTERSATAGQHSDETLLEARLTDSNGDPIAGQELVFELTGEESSRDFAATTNEDGLASVTPTLQEKPGPYQLTVRYAGDDGHTGDADTVSFVVDKEDSALELSVHGEDDDKTLRARLSDRDTPSHGIEQGTIHFYSDGELIGSRQTDADGVASVALPPRHRGNNRTYEAVFDGDDFYLGSSAERSGRRGGAR